MVVGSGGQVQIVHIRIQRILGITIQGHPRIPCFHFSQAHVLRQPSFSPLCSHRSADDMAGRITWMSKRLIDSPFIQERTLASCPTCNGRNSHRENASFKQRNLVRAQPCVTKSKSNEFSSRSESVARALGRKVWKSATEYGPSR